MMESWAAPPCACCSFPRGARPLTLGLYSLTEWRGLARSASTRGRPGAALAARRRRTGCSPRGCVPRARTAWRGARVWSGPPRPRCARVARGAWKGAGDPPPRGACVEHAPWPRGCGSRTGAPSPRARGALRAAFPAGIPVRGPFRARGPLPARRRRRLALARRPISNGWHRDLAPPPTLLPPSRRTSSRPVPARARARPAGAAAAHLVATGRGRRSRPAAGGREVAATELRAGRRVPWALG